MKNLKKKRGFTIVELVIVIAVIAILAAVLIPTFSNVIARSKISADTQLCKNLNTVLTMATSEGRTPTSMYDVLFLISESGYLLGNLNPTAEGYYFAWDSEGQKIVYIREDLNTVIYPEDYKLDKSKAWITVGDKEEAERIAKAGYNLYLERNIDLIELSNAAVSIDTGAFRLGELRIDGQIADQKTVVLAGNFGKTDLNVKNASFSTTGSISSLNVGSNTTGMTINGNVSSLASSISSVTMSSTGTIGKVDTTNSVASISVVSTTGSQIAQITSSNATAGVTGAVMNAETGKAEVSVSSKEAIENIRTQLAAGRTFENEVILLTNDVDMKGIAFNPISNNSRSTKSMGDANATWFKGEFDGKGHAIENLSTSGFSIDGLNAGTNGSSSKFATVYNEAIYGLFGTIYIPEGEIVTIKNLKIKTTIDMVVDDANKYVGDSVGALIGFAVGAGTLNIENVTIDGAVNGYDGIAAFIGRAYGVSANNANPKHADYVEAFGFTDAKAHTLTINFVNCTNNAAVTSVRKSGAFIGSSSNINRTFSGCVNNGNITCLGKDKDIELGCTSATGTNGSGYYQVGLFMDNGTKAILKIDGIINHGVIKVANEIKASN